jgi:hypothetical protein
MASSTTPQTTSGFDYRAKDPSEITVAVFGCTGYIGKKVTEEMINRGFKVTAVARERSGIGGKQSKEDVAQMFPGATVKFTDVTNAAKVEKDVFDSPVDVVVCCLASRTGGIKDSWLIDYQVRHWLCSFSVWWICTPQGNEHTRSKRPRLSWSTIADMSAQSCHFHIFFHCSLWRTLNAHNSESPSSCGP